MPVELSVDRAVSLAQRISALWRLKVVLTLGVNILFWGPYLILSRHAWRPVSMLPLTWLDRSIEFRPFPWAWVYESIFILTGTIPWLIASRDHLRRYVTGFALLAGVSFACFVLFPVASPRPQNLEGSGFLLFITHIDGPYNAFPSLHAGCLAYTLLLARRLFGREWHPLVYVCLALWGAFILYATIATRQHYALDLLAGGVLGWVADLVAWRGSHNPFIASTSTLRKRAVASNRGCI
jgi:membrane-associated phospholipid phosphatase